ncbi:MAG: homocysteine S-methyltransferase family protein [Phycisphaerae bacterium]
MAFDFTEFSGKVRVLDGAWGTSLQEKGLPAGGAPELWNTLNPSSVEYVARGYVEAGSEAILTNTFGANRFVLASHGEGERTAELCEAAAAISRKAAEGTDVKLFGSIGPSGKIVMTGDVSTDELLAAFTEPAEALAFGGVDAIVLETFNELDELKIALDAVKSACELPVVACMTFASGPEKTATMMGNKPADLAKAAREGGADAIGANCGAGPKHYVTVTGLLAEATDLPVWIKPNAGLPEVRNRKTYWPTGPEEFASYIRPIVQAGATFVGGCCGTTAEHIAAVRKAVDELG